MGARPKTPTFFLDASNGYKSMFYSGSFGQEFAVSAADNFSNDHKMPELAYLRKGILSFWANL
jgi:hypothetical protein